MGNKNRKLSEQERRQVMERLWLIYYNDTLFKQGVISEAERNRMRIKINARCSAAGQSRAVM